MAEPTGEELLARLVDRVRDTNRARVEAARLCLRTIPGDLLPIAGWALDRLYVVATHSGVTLAPALGELVAAELLAGEEREELARFRPGRFRSVPA
ncbi:MAG: FAD-binding oxidoreductase [Solirubrobacterales bacterium]|nr:FAD-binding oxidoreductase [Solirubrobacterales bacterium]